MQITLHVVLSVVAAVVSAAVAAVAWRHREVPGGTSMAGFGAAAAVWTTGNAVQAASTTLDGKLLAVDAQYLGVVAIPVAWFAFACEYTGRRSWLDRRTLALLAVQPVLTLALVWTNDAHHLVRTGAELVTVGGAVGIERSFGSWFWFTQTYSNVLLGLGTLLLLREVVGGHRPFRGQVVAILVGATIPWVAQTAFLNDLTRLEPEVFFSVTAVAFTYAVVRHRLLDLVPVARDSVIAALDDGVVVVDGDGRVVDCNATARAILGDGGSPVGRPAEAALAAFPAVRSLVAAEFAGTPDALPSEAGADGAVPDGAVPDDAASDDAVPDGVVPDDPDADPDPNADPAPDPGDGVRTVSAQVDGEVRHFVPGALDLDGADGVVVHLRDVTALKRRERELRARNERLDRVARRIAHDLRNPLTVAGGYLELVGENGDAESLAKVEGAHDRMASIIDDVLTEARGDVRTHETVDLPSVVDDAWANVATADAELRMDVATTLVADRSRLVTMLENLFRNATDHAGPDATVTVGTFDRRRADGTTATEGFYVADDGPGIPPSARSQVFERGYSTGGDGAGIGLTIVAAVADEHGWEVAVADDPEGTRIEVSGVEVGGRRQSPSSSEM